MKIIFSPSKGMKYRELENLEGEKQPFFPEKTEKLISLIQNFPMEKLKEVMKIKGQLLDQTFSIYENFWSLPTHRSIELYNGVSFSNMEPEKYSHKSLEYMKEHLRILSALYGVLCPETIIREYRLDMTMKISDFSLYSYWKDSVAGLFQDNETIINLASGEFSKILDRKRYHMTDIEFRQKDSDRLKNISTEAKKMRGKLLDYMIKNCTISVEDIKKFSQDGYSFSKELSTEHSLFFIKTL